MLNKAFTIIHAFIFRRSIMKKSGRRKIALVLVLAMAFLCVQPVFAKAETVTYVSRANNTSLFKKANKKLVIKSSKIYKLNYSNGRYIHDDTDKTQLKLKVNSKTKYRICDEIDDYTSAGTKSTYKAIKTEVDDIFESFPYADGSEAYHYLYIKVKDNKVKSVTLRYLL